MRQTVWPVILVLGAALAVWAVTYRPLLGAGPPARAPAAGAQNAEPTAANLLEALGLRRSGGVWALPEEVNFRERIATLERMERRLIELRQSIDQSLDQNETFRVRLGQAQQEEKRLRGLQASAKAGSAQRKQFDAELTTVTTLINQLRQLYQPPDRLGVGPPLRPLNVELVGLRDEMAIGLLPLRPALDKLLTRYDLLRIDAGVAAAIAGAGSEPLGPARTVRDAGKTLDRLHAVVFPDWLPVYRDGNLYRVTALANDCQPMTFSFGDTGQRTVITQSLAEAAGLKVDDAAPRVKFRVAAGRDELVQVVRIPRLRFGRVILTNVEAGVLPPEAADVGARIGPASFEGHRVHLDTEHLSLYVPGS
jgi:hypothetical protein